MSLINQDIGQGVLLSNAYSLTPATAYTSPVVPIFAGIFASLEQQMINVERKSCICTRSDLLFVRGPVCRRALTIFICEVHIGVCGCVPYNRKADFDIAIRLFRLGARLLAQYESD